VRVASLPARRGARAGLAAAVGVAVLLVSAGCNFISPQATTKQYDASDGRSLTIGDLAVRNAIALTDDGTEASLVMTLINSGGDDISVTVQYPTADGDDQTQVVEVPASSEVRRGTQPDQPQLVMSDVDLTPGQLVEVFFQYGTETGDTLGVPVLTGALPEYSTLLPTPVQSGSTEAPSGESTGESTTLPSPEDGTPSATPTP